MPREPTPEPVYHPEAVTPAWLGAVLTTAGATTGGSIVGAEAEEIGTGQVGCNIRYRLRYDSPGRGPESVVVKFASRDPASRSAGIQTLTYETEVAFYRDLASTLDVSRPRCFFASVEPGSADVVLVLEDVGGVPGDQIAGCTPEQAALAVVEAARLHGPRWGDPTLLELSWLAHKATNAMVPGPALAMVWPAFLERYRPDLSEESLEVGERVSRSTTWVDPEPPALTVCHCDFRLDNMLFAGAGSARPLTVVDWQTAQLAVGTCDVSYFLSAAMDRRTRREHEEDLLGCYHEALSAYAVQGYDLEQCWEDYRRYSFGGFFMAVFAAVLVHRTDRGDAMFVTMANGAAAQVVDLDAFGYLA